MFSEMSQMHAPHTVVTEFLKHLKKIPYAQVVENPVLIELPQKILHALLARN